MHIKLFSKSAIILFLLILSVPLTVLLLQKQQTVGTKAQSGGPSVYTGVYAQDWDSVLGFEKDSGKPVSIVMQFYTWTEGNFPTDYMNTVRNHGSIPLISWESYDSNNSDATSWKNIASGSYDSYITQWAIDSRNWGHPYFLRLDWEMNGFWDPYAKDAADYVPMWQHVHDIFTKNGATNVTWVWCPNVDSYSTQPLDQFYPGSSYTDWVCMDAYNFGNTQSWSSWTSFSDLFAETYNHLLRLAPGKPIMIAEVGSAEGGGSKADWISDTFSNQLPNSFPNIKAFIWFNLSKETDWRIESSQASQNAYASAMATSYYSSYYYSGLSTSPIPYLGSLSSQTARVVPLITNTPTPTATPTQTPTTTPFPTKPLPKVTAPLVSCSQANLFCSGKNQLLVFGGGLVALIAIIFILKQSLYPTHKWSKVNKKQKRK